MLPHILLVQLKSLLARAPSFDVYAPSSSDHLTWLGQAHALVTRWKPLEASAFRLSCDFLGSFASTRSGHVAEIFGTLHRAVADLELSIPSSTQQAFGAGAMYEFFKALNAAVSSAQKSLYIIDPYMDDGIFDAYLSSVQSGTSVRLLVRDFSAKVKPAAEKFVAQYGTPLEVRKSKALHDRVVFVDGSECWVLGHSIKDAAALKPTYLAPLPPDVSMLKLADYEKIWLSANAI
jgi:hypothetical protein